MFELVQDRTMRRPISFGMPPLARQLAATVERLRNEGHVIGGADVAAVWDKLRNSRNPQRDLRVAEGNLRGTCPSLDKATREFRNALPSTSPQPSDAAMYRFAVAISQARGR